MSCSSSKNVIEISAGDISNSESRSDDDSDVDDEDPIFSMISKNVKKNTVEDSLKTKIPNKKIPEETITNGWLQNVLGELDSGARADVNSIDDAFLESLRKEDLIEARKELQVQEIVTKEKQLESQRKYTALRVISLFEDDPACEIDSDFPAVKKQRLGTLQFIKFFDKFNKSIYPGKNLTESKANSALKFTLECSDLRTVRDRLLYFQNCTSCTNIISSIAKLKQLLSQIGFRMSVLNSISSSEFKIENFTDFVDVETKPVELINDEFGNSPKRKREEQLPFKYDTSTTTNVTKLAAIIAIFTKQSGFFQDCFDLLLKLCFSCLVDAKVTGLNLSPQIVMMLNDLLSYGLSKAVTAPVNLPSPDDSGSSELRFNVGYIINLYFGITSQPHLLYQMTQAILNLGPNTRLWRYFKTILSCTIFCEKTDGLKVDEKALSFELIGRNTQTISPTPPASSNSPKSFINDNTIPFKNDIGLIELQSWAFAKVFNELSSLQGSKLRLYELSFDDDRDLEELKNSLQPNEKFLYLKELESGKQFQDIRDRVINGSVSPYWLLCKFLCLEVALFNIRKYITPSGELPDPKRMSDMNELISNLNMLFTSMIPDSVPHDLDTSSSFMQVRKSILYVKSHFESYYRKELGFSGFD